MDAAADSLDCQKNAGQSVRQVRPNDDKGRRGAMDSKTRVERERESERKRL